MKCAVSFCTEEAPDGYASQLCEECEREWSLSAEYERSEYVLRYYEGSEDERARLGTAFMDWLNRMEAEYRNGAKAP